MPFDTITSVPRFLTGDQCDLLVSLMGEAMEGREMATLRAGTRGASVHRLDNETWDQTARRYEPQGRIEMTELPEAVTAILNSAFFTARVRMQTFAPDACECWIYLEYSPGEYINPHIDYPLNEANPTKRKLAGISIQLNDEFTGGNFFVETFADPACWELRQGTRTLRQGAVTGTDWFDSVSRTRWVCESSKGTALIYGTNVVHGTIPVSSGRIKKFVGFLTE